MKNSLQNDYLKKQKELKGAIKLSLVLLFIIVAPTIIIYTLDIRLGAHESLFFNYTITVAILGALFAIYLSVKHLT